MTFIIQIQNNRRQNVVGHNDRMSRQADKRGLGRAHLLVQRILFIFLVSLLLLLSGLCPVASAENRPTMESKMVSISAPELGTTTYAREGSTLVYTYTVKAGDVDLTDVNVEDYRNYPTADTVKTIHVVDRLLAGQTASVTDSYTITHADACNLYGTGGLTNDAYATGVYGITKYTSYDSKSLSVTFYTNANLLVEKTDSTTSGYAYAGDTITYYYTVIILAR